MEYRKFNGALIPQHWRIKKKFLDGVEPRHGEVVGTQEELYPGFLIGLLVWIVEDNGVGSISVMTESRYQEHFKVRK